MSQIDLDRLSSTLNLTPAQRAHLESLAAQTSGGASQQQQTQQVNLRIHITPGTSLGTGGDAQSARAQHDPLVESAFARLSPEMRRALLGIEPQVLKWINASQANAQLFTTDPLGALRKAAPGLDRKTLDALIALRADSQKQATAMPAFTGVNLRSVTLDAKPSPTDATRAPAKTETRAATKKKSNK
jgi:hypothetical protein